MTVMGKLLRVSALMFVGCLQSEPLTDEDAWEAWADFDSEIRASEDLCSMPVVSWSAEQLECVIDFTMERGEFEQLVAWLRSVAAAQPEVRACIASAGCERYLACLDYRDLETPDSWADASRACFR